MPTGNTTLLGLALPIQGELAGTWGTVVNNSITSLVDSAIAGTTTLSADADVILSTTVLAANQARQAIILWTASNGATTRNITAPAQSKPYIVINAGTGSIVLRGAGSPPTVGITIVSGEKCLAAWNGSDFVKIASSVADGVTSVGGTGTVNGITLTGTVTSTGNLTLGGALTGVNLASQVTGTLPVANGGTGVTTSTGTGNVVLSTSPTLVTPALGTPSSVTLTNATGLPISSGVSGLGTGITSFLATPSSANLAAAVTNETGSGSLVFATSPTLVTPALGTPSSVTLTNATGLPVSTGISGLGTGIATFLATPSSANLATAVTNETGSGALVFANSPTLSGTPLAPTASVGTSTTQIATTEYVINQIGAISAGVTTFSAGTTGLTPSSATSGAVTLAGTLAVANGGTGATTAANARTGLGATTLGANLFTVANPSTVTFPRFNADNTVSSLSAADFRTAIGAGSGAGTVTSVGGTGTVNGITLTGTVTSSGNLTLGGTLSNVSLATQVTGTLPIANGGTGNANGTVAKLATTNFTVEESGGVLVFKYGATTIASMTSAGVFTTLSNITGNGTP